MFGFLKKKKNEQSVENNFRLVSAVAGKSIPLSEVPDPVFAQKMAGDGIAIDTTGDTIV
ncbi:PTS glucose transporter subunit IIA, partial [Veillonella sp.]